MLRRHIIAVVRRVVHLLCHRSTSPPALFALKSVANCTGQGCSTITAYSSSTVKGGAAASSTSLLMRCRARSRAFANALCRVQAVWRSPIRKAWMEKQAQLTFTSYSPFARRTSPVPRGVWAALALEPDSEERSTICFSSKRTFSRTGTSKKETTSLSRRFMSSAASTDLAPSDSSSKSPETSPPLPSYALRLATSLSSSKASRTRRKACSEPPLSGWVSRARRR
mmetsp:Transcript_103306/g.246052  ORF Transcript_103306/g.246052 Transcript_103306/m.246052 type:complete len:225 (-) Transcript_103306:605-1279(-)